MVSPGTAGLSSVTSPAFAQHKATLSGLKITCALSLTFAEKGMPLPSGPGILARSPEHRADDRGTAGILCPSTRPRAFLQDLDPGLAPWSRQNCRA